MKFDPASAAGLILALLVASGLAFAAAACALWLRAKLGRAHAGGRIEDMRPGRQFVVLRDFTDDRGVRFHRGQVLTLVEAQVRCGAEYMLRFNQRSMLLHPARQADIILRTWAYLAPAARQPSG